MAPPPAPRLLLFLSSALALGNPSCQTSPDVGNTMSLLLRQTQEQPHSAPCCLPKGGRGLTVTDVCWRHSFIIALLSFHTAASECLLEPQQ